MPRRLKLLPSQTARPEPLAALVSAGAHGLIIGAIVLGSAVGTVAWEAFGELPEGLRFLVPPVTSPAPSQKSVDYASQEGDGGTSLAAKTGDFGDRRVGTRTGAAQTGVAAAGSAMDADDEIAAMNALLANAYQVVEVDSAAVRDPSSAAPAYPPALEARGVEGHVIVRFVVDSTGRVDMASVMTVEATAPEFDRAVREALPLMRFRPAKVGERPVRQLAEQLFRFEVAPLDPSRADPAVTTW
jgi:TonB family protein